MPHAATITTVNATPIVLHCSGVNSATLRWPGTDGKPTWWFWAMPSASDGVSPPGIIRCNGSMRQHVKVTRDAANATMSGSTVCTTYTASLPSILHIYIHTCEQDKTIHDKNFVTTIISLRYVSAVYAVIVCQTVCLSVTCWYCVKTAKHRITAKMPHGSPGTLVFWCYTHNHFTVLLNFVWDYPGKPATER